MKKAFSPFGQAVVHILSGVFCQAGLWSLLIWAYTTRLQTYLETCFFVAFLLLIDYLISSRLRFVSTRLIHLMDLVIILPSLVVAGIQVLQMIQDSKTSTLLIPISVILLNSLILFERVFLAKASK